ncbi:hypothetical protein ACFYKX_11455 [Cytobacillus sp. FJAT-54145]|uniref:Uncharacterized protein n=1 Tax=Cytobacillus spartinae TaxID=3299023 RepID=A0ABW6KCA5_9BACI
MERYVKILTGDYQGKIALVKSRRPAVSYPVEVQLPTGEGNAYYEEQVEFIQIPVDTIRLKITIDMTYLRTFSELLQGKGLPHKRVQMGAFDGVKVLVSPELDISFLASLPYVKHVSEFAKVVLD